MTRLRTIPVAVVLALFFSAVAARVTRAAQAETLDTILARIKPPKFPNNDFVITDFGGAAADVDCTDALRKAIAACHDAGGGRVVVPAGVFRTGAVHLKSNVNLHVAAGATLKFDPDPAKYLPVVFTRYEGVECMNYSPLIYAYGQDNVAVTGPGTLDGSATQDNWLKWSARPAQGQPSPQRASVDRLVQMGEDGVPVEQRVFGDGHYLRPNFIQIYKGNGVLIEGVTVINSPMWVVHPVLSTNVTVRGVTVRSHGANNDGCDPESCRDVLIEDCTFDTGDDCIAIKSGRNNDGRRVGVESENIVVRRCRMIDGHGGVTIGSEVSGGCRNVFAHQLKMDSPNLNQAVRFKNNARRGGMIENVHVRDVEIGRVRVSALSVEFNYQEGANGPHKPVLRNVTLENVTTKSCGQVLNVDGFPGAVIENVSLKNCTFRGVERPDRVRDAQPPVMVNVTVERAAAAGAVNVIDGAGFPLVVAGKAACIVLPADAPEVVKIAARDLAADVAAITGSTPEVLADAPADKDRPRVELVLAPRDLAGRWEAFRLSASASVLTIAGSDRRGLAYGVYEVSRRVGVSPWHWWADVPVPRRAELRLSLGEGPVDQPAVKYRGIFINDEDWGLVPWAAKTFEPEVGNLGPKTYARVFELLLRLRGNLIWPGMHPTTTPFHKVRGNAAVADNYAIVVGSSHAEPMLRNNVGEWTSPKDRYNYLAYRDEVFGYWESRVKERTSGESLFTLGMRGIHDSPIVGPKTQPERIGLLERIFLEQRGLLAKYLGDGDATRVGQIFCPYKEVLDDYNAGLRVPEDVTIVWPDDNFGYVRRFATAAERARPGGLGVYYHLSYLGAPMSWLWVDTLPPALVWSEMTRAYEQGARTVWMANVGDLKNAERSTEFFLDLAWHADRTNLDAPGRFMRETAARDFGKEHAGGVVDVLGRLHAINFARKAEHLQWHVPLTPYKPTELNEAEIGERLKACDDLLRDSDVLAGRLRENARDAYFQLVGYPVAITAAANERYFRAEIARADVARGRSPDANLAAAADAERQIDALTARYNDDVGGGKWRHVVTANGVSAKEWPRFQRDTKTPRPEPSADNVCPPAPPALGPLNRPDGAKPGDFVERDGVVSIHAGYFKQQVDAPGIARWRSVPGLGRSGAAVTVLPSTAAISPDTAPSLSYRFHTSTAGPAKLHVRLLPTHPLVTGQGLRLAVAINDSAPIPLAVTSGFDPKKPGWNERVLANATEVSAELPTPLSPGWHTLKLIAVDAGVVVDKIVIDLGGLRPAYDGPPETRLP